MDYYPDSGAFFAVYALIFLVFAIFALAGYILSSFFLMKIFEKAGVQGKWRAWVPVYNTMVFLKLGDMSPWLILYALAGTIVLGWVPVIGWLLGLASAALLIVAAWRVGLKLQKEAVWVVLYALLSIVWLGINAFDKSRWNPAIAPAPWGGNAFLADKTVWEGVPVQPSAAAAPQGYAAPAPQGYAPSAPQGYAPPAPQGYAPPAGSPVPPAPATPPVPPAPAAPAAPAAPVTPPAPPAPPAPPVDPNAQA